MIENKLNDYSGAIADFSRVIELNPKHAQSYVERGIAKINKGDKEDGCADLTKAGELGYEKAYDIRKSLCK